MAPAVTPWYERYSATGWYVAASIAVASLAQYFGDRAILLADAVRVVILALFVVTAAKVIQSAWEARHTKPGLRMVAVLSVPMYIGFAAVSMSTNLARMGQPPHWSLGVNLFLFSIATWRFVVSTKIMRSLVEEDARLRS